MPDTVIALFVPGRPAPQGSKRHVGKGRMIEVSKYVGPWRDAITRHARDLMADRAPLDGAVRVDIELVLPRPKSEPKTTRPHTRRPDVDKLARAVLDALTDIVFDDDSQVVRLDIRKRTAEHGELSGAHITVGPHLDATLHTRAAAQNAP